MSSYSPTLLAALRKAEADHPELLEKEGPSTMANLLVVFWENPAAFTSAPGDQLALNLVQAELADQPSAKAQFSRKPKGPQR